MLGSLLSFQCHDLGGFRIALSARFGCVREYYRGASGACVCDFSAFGIKRDGKVSTAFYHVHGDLAGHVGRCSAVCLGAYNRGFSRTEVIGGLVCRKAAYEALGVLRVVCGYAVCSGQEIADKICLGGYRPRPHGNAAVGKGFYKSGIELSLVVCRVDRGAVFLDRIEDADKGIFKICA